MNADELRYIIRPALLQEWEVAMLLAWKTFVKYDAVDYTKEGVQNFADFISDEKLHQLFLDGKYEMFVAISNNTIIGLITLRDKSHISLLFVKEQYHRNGIGRGLVMKVRQHVLKKYGIPYITVNSAPYGIDFYHSIGFIDVGEKRVRRGITVAPMRLQPWD